MFLTRQNLDGNVMGRTTINLSTVTEGSRLIIGNKQIEVRELALIFIYGILSVENLAKLILDYRSGITRAICAREEFRSVNRGTATKKT